MSDRSTCTSAHSSILTSSVFPEPDRGAAVITDVFLLNYIEAGRNKDLSMSQIINFIFTILSSAIKKKVICSIYLVAYTVGEKISE